MSRVSALLFAIIAYAIFFATFLYLIVFVGDFNFAAITVNKGPEVQPVVAGVIDLALIALFGLQHSVMARQEFKRQWTKVIPTPIERSVYVLAASSMLMVMFLFWHPIDQQVWNVTSGAGSELLWILFWIGWATVLLSTFLINHFDLGHLVLAAGISIYILIAIRFEEHDLVSLFGKDYELYREKVGMLTPRFRRRSS